MPFCTHLNLTMIEETNHHQAIIIGAGIHGLIAAKTFLQCDPSLSLRIIDTKKSIGGVWSKEAVYPELRTNNRLGTFQFTDLPLDEEFEVKEGEHIPGPIANEYLNRYAKKHNLLERCLLQTTVMSVERAEQVWKIECKSQDDENSFTMMCTKLVVATGITSSAAPVQIAGSHEFQRPIIKFSSLGDASPALIEDPSVRHVTVLGTGKAAYDSVYFLATHGKHVTWIMRASGHGPTWMSNPLVQLGPIKLWLERVLTPRLVSLFSPCIWGPADGFGWIRSMIHSTRMGRSLVKSFFDKLSYETLFQSGLLSDERLKPLIPDENAMWYGSGLSILNYPTNFHNFILSGQVQVFRKDISKLKAPNIISFSDPHDLSIETDAFISSTGWDYTLSFNIQPHEMHAPLGIPTVHHTKTQREALHAIDHQADAEILTRFPMLQSAPKPKHGYSTVQATTSARHNSTQTKAFGDLSPWRLWRGIAPPGVAGAPVEERNIVFLGMMSTLQNFLRSEISALWAYAWMNGHLNPTSSFPLTNNTNPPQDPEALILKSGPSNSSRTHTRLRSTKLDLQKTSVFFDTALFNRYCKWRHPYGHGSRFPDVSFDGLPYHDLLLSDLGLRRWRKGGFALTELFSSGYLPRDYSGIIEEWLSKGQQATPSFERIVGRTK